MFDGDVKPKFKQIRREQTKQESCLNLTVDIAVRYDSYFFDRDLTSFGTEQEAP